MATKTKAPPKLSSGDAHALLNNPSSKAYSRKMANLLTFLNATANIRTGAEIVETGITIDQNGRVIPLKELQEDFIHRKMENVEFYKDEMDELDSQMSTNFSEQREQHEILRRKNTVARKERAEARLNELEAEYEKLEAAKKELGDKINSAKEAERARLIAAMTPQPFSTNIEISVEEMRELLMLYTGNKIRINLTTGSYTFPIPVDTPFYREVCNTLGLPLPNQEQEKPVIKRVFMLNNEVLTAIKKALNFVSTDVMRPAMTGVNIEINNNKLIVVATDAHVLFQSRTFDVSGPDGSYNYLIPASALKRLPKSVKEDFGLYELKDGKISMFEKTITLIDSTFPNWRVVMPTNYTGGVTFDRQEMLNAVKEVHVYSNKSTSQVNFNINGQIELSAQDVDFSFESVRRVGYKQKTMDDLLIAFNGKYMVESLKTFDTNEVTFKAISATKAGIITDGSKKSDTVLIMPLMLHSY